MAPEIHEGKPYSFGVDFWSATIVLYWMLLGRVSRPLSSYSSLWLKLCQPPWYEVESEYEDEDDEDVKPLAYKIAEDPIFWDPADTIDEVTKDFLERVCTIPGIYSVQNLTFQLVDASEGPQETPPNRL